MLTCDAAKEAPPAPAEAPAARQGLIQALHRHRRLLQLAFGLSVLGYLLGKFEFGQIVALWGRVNFPALAGLWWTFTAATMALSGANLFILLKAFGPSRGALAKILRTVPRLEFFSLVVPGRLADVSLLHFLSGHATRPQVLAALFLDKVITLGVVGALAALGIGIAFGWLPGAALAGAGLAGLAVLSQLLLGAQTGRLRSWLGRKLLRRYSEKLKGFRSDFLTLLKAYPAWLANLALTLGKLVLYGAVTRIGYSLFGTEVPLGYLILTLAAAQLISILPISPWGLGVFEGTNIFLLEKVGVPPQLVLSFFLATRPLAITLLAILNLALTLTARSSGKQQT